MARAGRVKTTVRPHGSSHFACRALPEHRRTRMCAGPTHGNVIFVPRTIAQANTRLLLRRLNELIEREGKADWRSRVFWLRA